jgi:2',3'-cyclic-nucleotide 2'-phosphodiesterase/3'-nucleotidase
LLVTGAELKAWLERSFSQFTQIAPGAQDWPLLDPDFPSFTFDTIEGLTWAVDLAATAWVDARGAIEPTHPPRRILDLSYQGQAVACDQHFVLATNSYRASGSGGFAGARTKALPLGPPINSRDALAAYIAQTGPITDQARPNWHFAPMAGTTVVFDTSPRAASHLSAVSPAMLVPLSLTPQGFRRFRLHL